MKVSEIIKLLKQKGWKLSKHGARHDRWENRFYEGFVLVPRHKSKELSKGVENDIRNAIKKADIHGMRNKND